MKQCMDSDNLHRRLKKIIGQVQAIDRMIDEDVPCEDILSKMVMLQNQHYIKLDKLFWRVIFITVFVMELSMEMQKKQ